MRYAERVKTVVKTFLTAVRALGDEPSIVISTPDVDRQGDVVDPMGAELDNYRRNPVVNFAHETTELPVGACTQLDVAPGGIVARWRWLEGNDRATSVRAAYEQGMLRAASIGFIPLESEPRQGGFRFKRWELTEWSLVPVPANAECVRRLKGLGLWTPRVAKAGRVLSQMNEAHVREALAHASGCSDHLRQVLAALDGESDPGSCEDLKWGSCNDPYRGSFAVNRGPVDSRTIWWNQRW